MSRVKESTDTNLGNEHSDTSSHSGKMGLVYSEPKQPQQPINQNITYQQTIYETPHHNEHHNFKIYEFPKFQYNYGWPEYSVPVYDRSLLYYPNVYPSPYKIKDDRISQFFLGSITVVGLFILYRIIDKNK